MCIWYWFYLLLKNWYSPSLNLFILIMKNNIDMISMVFKYQNLKWFIVYPCEKVKSPLSHFQLEINAFFLKFQVFKYCKVDYLSMQTCKNFFQPNSSYSIKRFMQKTSFLSYLIFHSFKVHYFTKNMLCCTVNTMFLIIDFKLLLWEHRISKTKFKI